MKALARLEGFLQDLVERPAMMLAPRRLHPLEMAAALTRAMESDALALADRVLAPDEYALRLNPEDYRQFAGVRRTLEREYAEYISRLTLERDLTLTAPATVRIIEAHDVRPGTTNVTTSFSHEAGTPHPGRASVAAVTGAQAPALVRAARAPAPGAAIEVLKDDGTVERRQTLRGDELVLGRRSSSGFSLPDPEVSRQHARIEHRAGRYYLRDLDSLNGTAVNGKLITGLYPLNDGDTITVGNSRLRFRQGG